MTVTILREMRLRPFDCRAGRESPAAGASVTVPREQSVAGVVPRPPVPSPRPRGCAQREL